MDTSPAATSRVHTGEGVARHARPRLDAEIPGIPAFCGSAEKVPRNLSRSLSAVPVLRVEGYPCQGRPVVRAERQLPSPQWAEPIRLPGPAPLHFPGW